MTKSTNDVEWARSPLFRVFRQPRSTPRWKRIDTPAYEPTESHDRVIVMEVMVAAMRIHRAPFGRRRRRPHADPIPEIPRFEHRTGNAARSCDARSARPGHFDIGRVAEGAYPKGGLLIGPRAESLPARRSAWGGIAERPGPAQLQAKNRQGSAIAGPGFTWLRAECPTGYDRLLDAPIRGGLRTGGRGMWALGSYGLALQSPNIVNHPHKDSLSARPSGLTGVDHDPDEKRPACPGISFGIGNPCIPRALG